MGSNLGNARNREIGATMSVPVIFIHNNRWETWIPTVLRQAEKYNEQVILISDHQGYTDVVNYREGMDRFYRSYVNMSSNPLFFEGSAFCRWIILAEYMEKENIPVAFHLDTDVLIFANMSTEYANKYAGYPVTLVTGNCGASTFITKECAIKFRDFLMSAYEDRNDTFTELKRVYDELQAQGLDGGACDMYAWKLFIAQNKITYAEMTDVANKTTYDHTIRQSMPGNYNMKDGIKDIQFLEDHMPYCVGEAGVVQFKSLHFQGMTDSLIPEFYRRSNG